MELVRVEQQGVLGIGDGILVQPGEDLDAGQVDEGGGVARVCQDGLLVRVDRLGELAIREVSLGFVEQRLLAAGGRGGGHEECGHIRDHHLVKINQRPDRHHQEGDQKGLEGRRVRFFMFSLPPRKYMVSYYHCLE